MIHRILAAFCMCLRKYTCLPRIWGEWDDDLTDVMPAFLPAVGLVIGLLWWLLAAIALHLLPGFLGAALAAMFPFAITGLANLKGYCRVGGNLLSKAETMQDAPEGLAASAMLIFLVLFQFSACLSLDRIFPLVMIPVLSRACRALQIMKRVNAAAEEGRELPASLLNIEKAIVIAGLVLMLLFSGPAGLFSGAAVLGFCALCSRVIFRDAFSGDEEGFMLTAAELCGLIVLAIF